MLLFAAEASSVIWRSFPVVGVYLGDGKKEEAQISSIAVPLAPWWIYNCGLGAPAGMTCALGWLAVTLVRNGVWMRGFEAGDERNGWGGLADGSGSYGREWGVDSRILAQNGVPLAYFRRTLAWSAQNRFSAAACASCWSSAAELQSRQRISVPDIPFARKHSWEDSIMRIVLLAAVPLLMATMAHAAPQSNESKLHRLVPRGWRGN